MWYVIWFKLPTQFQVHLYTDVFSHFFAIVYHLYFFLTCSVGVTLGQPLHRNDQTEITFESWTGFREVATSRKTAIVAEPQWKSFVMHAFLFLTTNIIPFLQYIHIDEQTWNFGKIFGNLLGSRPPVLYLPISGHNNVE